jgi:hypothetical protein
MAVRHLAERLTISQQSIVGCCWLFISCRRMTTVPNGAVIIHKQFCGAFHGPVGPHPPSPPPRAGSYTTRTVLRTFFGLGILASWAGAWTEEDTAIQAHRYQIPLYEAGCLPGSLIVNCDEVVESWGFGVTTVHIRKLDASKRQPEPPTTNRRPVAPTK